MLLSSAPSAWLVRWSHLLPPGATVLDLACGSGRHAQWLASLGCAVTAVDRDTSAIQATGFTGEIITADLESGPWPLTDIHGAPRQFDAVVVTNYLHRPLFANLLASLSVRGMLIYETFAQGNATFGRPSRDAFLLTHGELLRVCSGLHTIAYEEGYLADPPRMVQRIVAARWAPDDSAGRSPRRYALDAE